MKAIVIGGDHHNALGVIRALGREGVDIAFYVLSPDGKESYVARSKYVSKAEYYSSADELGDAILKRPRLSDGKEVILCCHDALASMLDRRQSEFKGRFFFPHSSKAAVSYLQDKSRMGELAVKSGLIIPPVGDDFPLMLKPLNSVKGTKNDMLVCADQNTYDNYFESHSKEETLVQKYIDKRLEYQLIGCVTMEDNIIIPGYSSILRPCKGSNTSFLEYKPLTKGFCDMPSCEKFLRATGFHGLFSMEFLRDASGRDYFLEINFRNDGNAICVTDAGVNLPMIWFLSCLGKDYSWLLPVKPRNIFVIPEFEELSLLTSKQISLSRMLKDFRKASSGMEWDARDPKPFFRLLGRRTLHKLKRR